MSSRMVYSILFILAFLSSMYITYKMGKKTKDYCSNCVQYKQRKTDVATILKIKIGLILLSYLFLYLAISNITGGQ